MAKRLFAVLECQSLLENLYPFVDPKRPKNFPDGESPTCPSPNSVIGFPELTEEPKSDSDRSVLCRLCVRLPDGRKVQRNFLRSESVQLLWSFCYSLMDESERRERSFKLIQAVPGEYKSLYYGSETSFEDSGLANSLISVIWVWITYLLLIIWFLVSLWFEQFIGLSIRSNRLRITLVTSQFHF